MAKLARFCDIEKYEATITVKMSIFHFIWNAEGSLLLKVLNGYGQVDRSVKVESASFDKQAKRLKACFPHTSIDVQTL